MKISKSISNNIISDFEDLKSILSGNTTSEKFANNTLTNCINIFNNEYKADLKTDKFYVELINASITLLDKSDKKYDVVGAKNIFTALVLAGCNNVDINVDKNSIDDLLSVYQHEKFVHVPESLHYLSSMFVYEDEDYYVVFVKALEIYLAFKIDHNDIKIKETKKKKKS